MDNPNRNNNTIINPMDTTQTDQQQNIIHFTNNMYDNKPNSRIIKKILLLNKCSR